MANYENAKRETKNRIVQEFWKLYKVTNIEKITVRNITDACGIYRTTFYLHFADVYAILEKIEDDLLRELRKIGSEIGNTEEGRRQGAEHIYEHFRKNYDYLHVLLDGKRQPDFTNLYKKEMVDIVCDIHGIHIEEYDPKSREVVKKTLHLLADLFLSWADSDLFSFEEIISITEGYMNKGIIYTLTNGLGHIKG